MRTIYSVVPVVVCLLVLALRAVPLPAAQPVAGGRMAMVPYWIDEQPWSGPELSQDRRDSASNCKESARRTAPFLRSDMAYSILNIDCVGDPPSDRRASEVRSPAGLAKCGPNEHPLFLRWDVAYSVTGIDCWGDEPKR